VISHQKKRKEIDSKPVPDRGQVPAGQKEPDKPPPERNWEKKKIRKIPSKKEGVSCNPLLSEATYPLSQRGRILRKLYGERAS